MQCGWASAVEPPRSRADRRRVAALARVASRRARPPGSRHGSASPSPPASARADRRARRSGGARRRESAAVVRVADRLRHRTGVVHAPTLARDTMSACAPRGLCCSCSPRAVTRSSVSIARTRARTPGPAATTPGRRAGVRDRPRRGRRRRRRRLRRVARRSPTRRSSTATATASATRAIPTRPIRKTCSSRSTASRRRTRGKGCAGRGTLQDDTLAELDETCSRLAERSIPDQTAIDLTVDVTFTIDGHLPVQTGETVAARIGVWFVASGFSPTIEPSGYLCVAYEDVARIPTPPATFGLYRFDQTTSTVVLLGQAGGPACPCRSRRPAGIRVHRGLRRSSPIPRRARRGDRLDHRRARSARTDVPIGTIGICARTDAVAHLRRSESTAPRRSPINRAAPARRRSGPVTSFASERFTQRALAAPTSPLTERT